MRLLTNLVVGKIGFGRHYDFLSKMPLQNSSFGSYLKKRFLPDLFQKHDITYFVPTKNVLDAVTILFPKYHYRNSPFGLYLKQRILSLSFQIPPRRLNGTRLIFSRVFSSSLCASPKRDLFELKQTLEEFDRLRTLFVDLVHI